jgi:uncharacterized protein
VEEARERIAASGPKIRRKLAGYARDYRAAEAMPGYNINEKEASLERTMDSLAVQLSPAAIEAFCKRWKIRQLAVFGSALAGDFRIDSDLDVLVNFADDARWSLWDVIAAEQELAEIVGRPVDLVERKTVEQSENWIRRDSILSKARIIYEG